MNVLILIQRKSIQLYYTDRSTPIVFAVPETAVKDMDVVDEKALMSVLTKQLLPEPPKVQVQAMLFIGTDLCFSAKLEKDKEEIIKKELIDTSPFSLVGDVTIPISGSLVHITANRGYYEAISKHVEAFGYTVVGVFPWAIVQHMKVIRDGETFGSVSVRRLFENAAALKPYAFPCDNQVNVVATPTNAKPSMQEKPKIPLWWFIFGAGAVLYLLVMYIGFLRR